MFSFEMTNSCELSSFPKKGNNRQNDEPSIRKQKNKNKNENTTHARMIKYEKRKEKGAQNVRQGWQRMLTLFIACLR